MDIDAAGRHDRTILALAKPVEGRRTQAEIDEERQWYAGWQIRLRQALALTKEQRRSSS